MLHIKTTILVPSAWEHCCAVMIGCKAIHSQFSAQKRRRGQQCAFKQMKAGCITVCSSFLLCDKLSKNTDAEGQKEGRRQCQKIDKPDYLRGKMGTTKNKWRQEHMRKE